MTELRLYKFINDNKIEYNFCNDGEIYAFIPFYELKEFTKLLGYNILSHDDNLITAVLKDGYLGVEMSCICDYFAIDPKNIFEHGR